MTRLDFVTKPGSLKSRISNINIQIKSKSTNLWYKIKNLFKKKEKVITFHNGSIVELPYKMSIPLHIGQEVSYNTITGSVEPINISKEQTIGRVIGMMSTNSRKVKIQIGTAGDYSNGY